MKRILVAPTSVYFYKMHSLLPKSLQAQDIFGILTSYLRIASLGLIYFFPSFKNLKNYFSKIVHVVDLICGKICILFPLPTCIFSMKQKKIYSKLKFAPKRQNSKTRFCIILKRAFKV